MNIGYARVSTHDQTPEMQLDALRQVGCERIFQEKASGAQRDRPELADALDYMRPGDTLVIWKLDRLARSLKQLIETVELLEQREVCLKSITEDIDTGTSSGRLIFHIFGALAEFERSIIRERTMAGLVSAKARGRVGGRPKALSDQDIAAAKALLKQPDLTAKDVAARVGVSLATLYRYIPAARAVITHGERT